jgi:site-specific recombinase XerD
MKKVMVFSSAVEGFQLSMGARHLSPNTVADYSRTLSKFAAWLGADRGVGEITSKDIEGFMGSFTDKSNKSLLNYHVGLSAMWSWMEGEGIVKSNVVRKVKPPRAERKEVTPLTEAEVKALFAALNRSKVYQRGGQPVDHALGSMERNRAILLLLLDTGIRASELCDLKVEDLDNRNNRIFVRMGKGMKERLLPFSPRTGQMIWRYLAARKDAQGGDPLFVSKADRALSRTKLSEMFRMIGRRAGVENVHPHRFRHTFAIQYLRNGGNVYTLQAMLGHSTLETVRIYLQLAQVDLDQVHRRASPVDNWRL